MQRHHKAIEVFALGLDQEEFEKEAENFDTIRTIFSFTNILIIIALRYVMGNLICTFFIQCGNGLALQKVVKSISNQ